MHTETLSYTDAGTTLKGFLAYDDKKTGKRPGILVMPEAFGLGKNAKNRAQRLAELGYVALGGDPFGDGKEFTDLQDAIKVAGALMADPAKLPPAGRATVKDFVNHIDYAVKLIGIDHVGISSDFDGGGGIDGWNSAAEAFNVTLELVRRGYTEEQIGKLWSGNLLRVWGEVEKVAQRLKKQG